MNVELTKEEIQLLAEALDSHIYWQLSDPQYRASGYVADRGSNDPETREQIRKSRRLLRKFDKLARPISGEEVSP